MHLRRWQLMAAVSSVCEWRCMSLIPLQRLSPREVTVKRIAVTLWLRRDGSGNLLMEVSHGSSGVVLAAARQPVVL